MCLFKAPKLAEPETVARAPLAPEAPPEAPEIGASMDKMAKRNGRNSLRIDLAGAGNTSLGRTGLNI